MTNNDFQKVVIGRIEHIKTVLAAKGKEYTAGHDRLSNFKRAAAILQVTPIDALLGMWVKHLVSILDLLDRQKQGEEVKYSLFNEKLGDSINYEILLDALIREKELDDIRAS